MTGPARHRIMSTCCVGCGGFVVDTIKKAGWRVEGGGGTRRGSETCDRPSWKPRGSISDKTHRPRHLQGTAVPAGTLPSRASRHRLTLCASLSLPSSKVLLFSRFTPTTPLSNQTGCQKKNPPICPEHSPVLYQTCQYIRAKYQRNTNSRTIRITHAVPVPDGKHVHQQNRNRNTNTRHPPSPTPASQCRTNYIHSMKYLHAPSPRV